eukprot:12672472-Ditylum_brightwellii.AAC.1
MPSPDTAKDSSYKDIKSKPLDHIHTNHNTPANNTNRKNPYGNNQDSILSATKSAAIGHHNVKYSTIITRNINTIYPSR